MWQGGGKGVTTVWVEPDGAAVSVKRKRPEATIATRHGLYGIRATVGRESTLDAVPLAGGAALTVVQAAVEGCLEGEQGAPCVNLDERLRGDRAPARGRRRRRLRDLERHDVDARRAAPGVRRTTCEIAFDVAAGQRVPLAPFPGFDRLTKIANAKFLDAYGPDGGGCIQAQDSLPNLDHADFAFDGSGKLHGHYWFTKPSNYMCGAGPGHRSVAIDVNDSALPDPMKPLMQAPKWLAPYLAKHPSIGVSPIPTELRRRESSSPSSKAPAALRRRSRRTTRPRAETIRRFSKTRSTLSLAAAPRRRWQARLASRCNEDRRGF